jgi:ABC-type nitrate/sulfonate/bicarbonate transport system substrate-binding protein
MMIRFYTAVLLLISLLLSNQAGAAPLRIAYSSISGAMLPLWVAKDSGLFAKHGVDVDLTYIRGVAIEALLAGESPVCARLAALGCALRTPRFRSRVYCQYHQRCGFFPDVET